MMARLLLAIGLLMVCLVGQPSMASAVGFGDIFGGVDCKATGTTKDPASPGSSAICHNDGSDPITGSDGLLYHITVIVAFMAGAAAVILIIVGSIRYITSGGDAGKVSSAKGTITDAFIGLAIIAIATSIITFVLSRLH